jgi:uncharacterized protein YjlB
MKEMNANTIPETKIHQYIVVDNGEFPNSILPVVLYRQALHLPMFFASQSVKDLLLENGWGNNWRGGIFTYHHYHSNTHEVLAVIKGKTRLVLGGDGGEIVKIEKGDVIIIPAGVAHRNIGEETAVTCIAGYPGGTNYDMQLGRPGERPAADKRIEDLAFPSSGPVQGIKDPLLDIWVRAMQSFPIGMVS